MMGVVRGEGGLECAPLALETLGALEQLDVNVSLSASFLLD